MTYTLACATSKLVGVPVLTEATAMIASYLAIECELGRLAAGADAGASRWRTAALCCSTKWVTFPSPCKPSFCASCRKSEVQRLGSSDTLHVDARVTAATNADLAPAG